MYYSITHLMSKELDWFWFFILHRHQHLKPSAKEIAWAYILKADIFTLEKPDISILGLHSRFV